MLLFLVLTSVAPGERPCRGVLRGVLLDDGLDLVGVFVGVLPLLLLSMLIVQCHFDVVPPLPCVGHEFESRVKVTVVGENCTQVQYLTAGTIPLPAT